MQDGGPHKAQTQTILIQSPMQLTNQFMPPLPHIKTNDSVLKELSYF